MPLEYNVKREYTIPGLTAYFSVFSVVAIVALAVLNVVLQGYDIVTVLRPNPNVTEHYWWSTNALSVRSAGECNPVSLPRKSFITTNSSLFSYELRGTFGANKQEIAGASSYMANPLRNCTVDGIVANIDLVQQLYQFEVPVRCISSELPYSLSLSSKLTMSTLNPYSDDLVAYYLQGRSSRDGVSQEDRLVERNASSPFNIISILDAMNADLTIATQVARDMAIGTPPNLIVTGGLLACPGGQNSTCPLEDMKMTVPQCAIGYPNGTGFSSTGICPLLAPFEPVLLNMFTVLQDAYHIDFGNIQPSNTLLSMDEFSSRIHSSPAFSQIVRNNSLWLCTWGLGCSNNSTWADKLLASDPSINVVIPTILTAGNTSAVIKVDYLCPQFTLKTPGSLITSVFIGTWSMYMALVGIFGVVGPVLEQRYGRSRTGSTTDVPVPDYELKS